MIEKCGKTIFLLKEKAKPVAENRKRRKIALMALPRASHPVPSSVKPPSGDVNMNDEKFRNVQN